MIYIKTHEAENGSVIAMCDESLIDKVLNDGDVYLDIKSYSSFYKGELVSADRAMKIIGVHESVHSANLIGKESVEVGLEVGLIDKSSVLEVKKIPYAHAYKVDY